VTISVGGEIGEVGTQNSTVDELRAYLDGYRRELEARAPGAKGISKVSVQTGTSHGGVPLPDGSVAEVKLDFEVLRRQDELEQARLRHASAIADYLSARADLDGLSGAMVTGRGLEDNLSALAVVGVWAVFGIVFAIRGFSWESRRDA